MTEPVDIRLGLPRADRKHIALGLRDEGTALAKELRSHLHALRGNVAGFADTWPAHEDAVSLAEQLRWLADQVEELGRRGNEYRALVHDVPWRELLTLSGRGLSRNRPPEERG